MTSNKYIKGVYKEHRGPLADWVWNKWGEKGITMQEFSAKTGTKYNTLSTMLGGEDRLSEGTLTKLVRGLIQHGCIDSGAEFQELLDVLRLCPGYKLDYEEEDRLRVVAGDELKAKGVVTIDAASTTLVSLYKEVRALSNGEFKQWEEKLRQGGSKFQSLIGLFHSWREDKRI